MSLWRPTQTLCFAVVAFSWLTDAHFFKLQSWNQDKVLYTPVSQNTVTIHKPFLPAGPYDGPVSVIKMHGLKSLSGTTGIKMDAASVVLHFCCIN